MTRTARMIIVGLVLTIAHGLLAQDSEPVTVPDVTGLKKPQAAAVLNEAGLAMGQQIDVTEAQDDIVPGTVADQSIPPGTVVDYGTAIDVTILQPTNALLIYDDNDITLVNRTGEPLDLHVIEFNSLDGDTGTSFSGSRWAASVGDGNCVQLWSIAVRGPKALPECGSTRWLTTNNPGEHFWTGSNNATEFHILQAGIQRAICPVSMDGRCEFFLETSELEVTDYVYFAYTRSAFSVLNQSEDLWMPVQDVTITDARGGSFALGDAQAYDAVSPGVINWPAPGQCLLLTGQAAGDQPPQRCNIIARQHLDGDFVFWQESFSLISQADGERRECPGATEGHLTLCILPR